MTESQLSSTQDLKNSADPERKSTQYQRPWITPSFKPLDLSTARASGCRSANDGGSC
jgi:hypothetical protein